ARSAKITGEGGRFEQAVAVSPQSVYELTAFVRGAGVIGVRVSGETFTKSSNADNEKWIPIKLTFSTADASEAKVFGVYGGGEGRFDDFRLVALESAPDQALAVSDQNNQSLDDPQIRILGGDLDSELSYILEDIVDVTSDESDIRVLSISGDGSLENIKDLLYLQGIDAAIVQSDILSIYRERSAVRNIEDKLVYIAQLGTTMGHLIAQQAIATIHDLEGKRIYIGDSESSSFFTASNIFERLGIAVSIVDDLGPEEAIISLNAGKLDAAFLMGIPPVGLMHLASQSEELHFLHIPSHGIDNDIYGTHMLSQDDYPTISEGEEIQTVTAQIALIAYDWPADHHRYAKMVRFKDILASKTDTLRSGDYHRSFRTADFYSDVGGGWRSLR
ncbi:MAG: TAXI family TRAP transporter solute-binding subunit, partial [Geminicoccaceae bacterium]